MLCLILLSFYAFNTATEEIVDVVSPEYSLAARHAKDLGSFGVLCVIIVNFVLVSNVFINLRC